MNLLDPRVINGLNTQLIVKRMDTELFLKDMIGIEKNLKKT